MSLKFKVVATLLATTLGTSTSAEAASDAELAELRTQIQQMKAVHEAQIKALEARLQGLEAAARQPESLANNATRAANATNAAPAIVPAQGRSTGEATFNPAISVVLNGAYGNFSRDPDSHSLSGFVPANNGLSPGTAYATLQHASNQTAPGDTVFAMNGTYTSSASGSSVLAIASSGRRLSAALSKA